MFGKWWSRPYLVSGRPPCRTGWPAAKSGRPPGRPVEKFGLATPGRAASRAASRLAGHALPAAGQDQIWAGPDGAGARPGGQPGLPGWAARVAGWPARVAGGPAGRPARVAGGPAGRPASRAARDSSVRTDGCRCTAGVVALAAAFFAAIVTRRAL